jgi:hypothetical protein
MAKRSCARHESRAPLAVLIAATPSRTPAWRSRRANFEAAAAVAGAAAAAAADADADGKEVLAAAANVPSKNARR